MQSSVVKLRSVVVSVVRLFGRIMIKRLFLPLPSLEDKAFKCVEK